jgi:shikimate dehydrogenase
MTLFGVTGHPVLHSRSPGIFGRLFASAGVDAAYTRVAAPTAAGALSLARRVGMRGLNVTAPFKEAMFRLATTRDESAGRLGAANTLLLEADAVRAFNTDPDGVRHALTAGSLDVRGSRVVVLGAGGAALAAGAALVGDGADVVFASRTAQRAAEAAARLGCASAELSGLPGLLAGATGLVSCLPQGVDPVDEPWLHAGLWVLDANYRRSSLAAKARRRGCAVLDGADWLIGQAMAARRVFAGLPREEQASAADADRDAAAEIGRRLAAGEDEPARHCVALAGMMGAGKSVAGREIARRLGLEFADTDELIVARTGHDIRWLFDHRSEEEFRRIEADTIARAVDGRALVVALGGGSLEHEATVEHLRRLCHVVWLWASPACLAERTAADASSRPLLGDADPEPRLASLLAARTRSYASASDIVVDAERPVADIAELVAFEVGCLEE